MEQITERMLKSGSLKNYSALARKLGVTPQAISNYRVRNHIPSDLVIKFAGLYGLSVDWLLTGQGRMKLPEYKEENVPLVFATDMEIMEELANRLKNFNINGVGVEVHGVTIDFNEPTV